MSLILQKRLSFHLDFICPLGNYGELLLNPVFIVRSEHETFDASKFHFGS
jgi:hypothetical protein